jgi:hypothetical protein
MKFSKRIGFGVVVLLLASGALLAQDIPVNNWTVPPYTSSSHGGITTMTDVTPPRAFIGVQPCRVADTRGNGAPIQGGIFPNSGLRTWDLTGICGIPAGADAISVNFTVVSIAATPAGAFLLAWPTGQPPPPTAIMTYGPGVIILSNAAIVPLGPGEQINVNVSHSTHIIMDVNGYFSDIQNDAATTGAYLAIESNSAGYAIRGINNATVCGGPCGVEGIIYSNTSGSHAVSGYAVSATGYHYGVYGNASSLVDGSAGVAGEVGSFAGGFDPNGFNRAAFKAVSGDGNGLNAFVSGFSSGVSTHGSDATGVDLVNDAYLSWNEFFTFGMLTNGNVNIAGDLFVSGTKSFVQPHPTDASKQIKYISVEAPAAEIYYRGTAQIQRGMTRVEVPESFRVVASPGTYATIVTPVGAMATVAVMQEDENGIVIQASRDVKVHYVVHALRAGFENEQAIEPNILFQPGFGERYFQGLPAYHRGLLVQNKTLNPDGTPNRETATRLGWKLPPERTTTPE